LNVNQADTIRVQLNGKEREVARGLSVRALLEHLQLQPGAVVVELNREILERDSYGGVDVSEGDSIELVHFVGGG
jgi:thiamine biosynthesis protein ThiS